MKRVIPVLFGTFLLAGCVNNRLGKTEQGALGGAAAGAGLGAIIGHETGHTGGGIAIGSAAGALTGALVGGALDQQDRQYDERDRQIAEQDKQLRENRQLIDELRSHGVDVHDSVRGVVVNLPDVLFQFGKADLTPEARSTVREIARSIRNISDRRVSIEGHTDSVGSISYNYQLSEDRARNAADELVRNGVANRALTIRGLGESEPIASNRTEEGRRRNRRVEVIVENRRR